MIKYIEKIYEIIFVLLFYFGMGYGFLALYVTSSSINPDRLLTFGWIFGIIPLIGLLIHIRKNILKKILVVIFISFIVFNIYNIDSDYYTGEVIPVSQVVTEKEYLLAEQIMIPHNNSNTTYYGYPSVVAAIYDKQGIDQRTGGLEVASILNPHNYSTLAFINKAYFLSISGNLYAKAQNQSITAKDQYDKINKILSYKDKKDIDKICDLGNIYVLRGV